MVWRVFWRMILRAAPSCTLWELEDYGRSYRFRLWPHWRVSRGLVRAVSRSRREQAIVDALTWLGY